MTNQTNQQECNDLQQGWVLSRTA